MIKFLLTTLTKLLEIFKGFSCKMGMCCVSNCNTAEHIEKALTPDGEDIKERWRKVKGLDGDIETK